MCFYSAVYGIFPRQMKYCLWEDGVKRKSIDWLKIMEKIFDITAVRSLVEEDEIDAVLEEKRDRLSELLSFCEQQKYQKWYWQR